ncbi:MAG: hypothetical protein II793_02680 [Bacteroidales bacterium]|nr:hypothetical protein [Bacteroidales bacterium]
MKRLLYISILFIATTIMAQPNPPDSAEWVVGRYMSLMNYEAVPRNEMLFIESTAMPRYAGGDTAIVKRWYTGFSSCRIEVWQKGQLIEGWHNYEHKIFRKYDSQKKQWVDASEIHYYDHTIGYDFRGPLYKRATNGSFMLYGGIATFEGNKVYKVMVTAPGMFDRDYYFEQRSGLLFLIIEKETSYGEERNDGEGRLEWRSIDEYLPLGETLIVSKETYQQNGLRTTTTHKPTLMEVNLDIFKKD